jgi:hypothetical protein
MDAVDCRSAPFIGLFKQGITAPLPNHCAAGDLVPRSMGRASSVAHFRHAAAKSKACSSHRSSTLATALTRSLRCISSAAAESHRPAVAAPRQLPPPTRVGLTVEIGRPVVAPRPHGNRHASAARRVPDVGRSGKQQPLIGSTAGHSLRRRLASACPLHCFGRAVARFGPAATPHRTRRLLGHRSGCRHASVEAAAHCAQQPHIGCAASSAATLHLFHEYIQLFM